MNSQNKLLTLEHILASHQLMIDCFGGSPGCLKPDVLKALVGGVEQAVYYQEFTVFEMAAKYGYRLITQHCFVDGNKRVGAHVMLTYLDVCGVTLHITDKALEEMTLAIAKGESSEADLVAWLEQAACPAD